MKTTTNYQDFEVTELTNEDAAEVLSAGLELEPTEEERVRKVLAPRPLHVVPIAEQMRIAHDKPWTPPDFGKWCEERSAEEELRWRGAK